MGWLGNNIEEKQVLLQQDLIFLEILKDELGYLSDIAVLTTSFFSSTRVHYCGKPERHWKLRRSTSTRRSPFAILRVLIGLAAYAKAEATHS